MRTILHMSKASHKKEIISWKTTVGKSIDCCTKINRITNKKKKEKKTG